MIETSPSPTGPVVLNETWSREQSPSNESTPTTCQNEGVPIWDALRFKESTHLVKGFHGLSMTSADCSMFDLQFMGDQHGITSEALELDSRDGTLLSATVWVGA